MPTDWEAHLRRQIAFSRATFGPNRRLEGIVAHLRKELDEVLESHGSPEEWVDVVILALDGLTRSMGGVNWGTDICADEAVRMIVEKQAINESRDWPDWRTMNESLPIEHVRATT